MPLVENLRLDPFERAADEGMGYQQWMAERMFTFAPAGALRRAVVDELPRIRAAPKARQLQPGPRHGSDDEATGGTK